MSVRIDWVIVARLIGREIDKKEISTYEHHVLDLAWRANAHRYTELAVRARAARIAERRGAA